jgi:hypothetical protein
MPELSRAFLEGLRDYDDSLEAIYESERDSIVIWSNRKGMKVHELTLRRQFGELYPELERRTLKILPQKDVWKRFGSGKAYDDHLAKEEEEARARAKSAFMSERQSMMKDERLLWEAALWNASHGRFKKGQVLPYNPSRTSVPIQLGR